MIKLINKITDFKLQKDLLNHLAENGNDIDKAFSTEGIEKFNQNRKIPVYKLPIAESGKGRFAVGNGIGTKHKFVEADKGTNLFFAIYYETGKRYFETIPLNEVIEHQKWRATLPKEQIEITPMIPTKKEMGEFLFSLSPNDLVYVPTVDEAENPYLINFENLSKDQAKRLFQVNDFSGYTIYFMPNRFAKAIAPKELDTSFDAKLTKFEGNAIKDNCIKLKVDRLGNISF